MLSRAHHLSRTDDGEGPEENGGSAAPAPCSRNSADSCLPAEAPQIAGTGVRRPASVSSEEVCPGAGYLCAGLQSGDSLRLRRWPDSTARIRVAVPLPQGMAPDRARELQRAAVRGVEAWDRHPFPVTVSIRDDHEGVDVPVSWVQTLTDGRLGRTQVEWRRTGEEFQVRVLALLLATREPFDTAVELTPRQVELVAAHEMGHVLGLPHSDDPRDIMYPENTATRLSVMDFRTLEALYRLPNWLLIRGR